MKKLLFAIVLSFLFVFLGSTVNVKAEMEKDVKGLAKELTANKAVNDKLDSDIKWYKFKVTETGVQQFQIKALTGSGRYNVMFYYVDKDGALQEIMGDATSAEEADGTLFHELSYQKGTILYASISAYYNETVGNEYALTVKTDKEPVKDCKWAEKDADSSDTANKITSKTKICSILNTKEDSDWYKYEVKNDKEFSFNCKSMQTSGDYCLKMQIYIDGTDGNLQMVTEGTVYNGADGLTLDKLTYKKGTNVYVQIVNCYGWANGERYIVSVTDSTENVPKVDTPISILANSNIVVGKAEAGAAVTVQYGKKKYTGTADEDGIYRIITAKLKKGKKVTIWQKVGNDTSEKVTVKVATSY